MKKNLKVFIVIFLVILTLFLFIKKGSYSIEETFNDSDAQSAVIKTALAYFDRKEDIQYDYVGLTFLGSLNERRGQDFFNPEVATAQNKKFTTCSGFAYQVYYNTFVDSNGKGYRMNSNLIGEEDRIIMEIKAANLTQFANENSQSRNKPLSDGRKVPKIEGRKTIFNSDMAIFYIDEDTFYMNDNGTITKKYHNNSDDNTILTTDIGTFGDYFVPGEKPTTNSSGNYNNNKAEKIREDILSLLEPGDIIVTRTVTKDENTGATSYGGHTAIYIGTLPYDVTLDNGTVVIAGNKLVIEANEIKGGWYAFKANEEGANVAALSDYIEPNGAIRFHNLLDINGTGNGVLGSNNRVLSANVNAIAILRPINEVKNNNYTISRAAMIRNSKDRLTVEKTSNVNRFDSVNPGDEITYTIKFTNNRPNSSGYSSITINDTLVNAKYKENIELSLPSECTITSNRKNLSCIGLSVGAYGSTYTISYTVISDSTAAGSNVESITKYGTGNITNEISLTNTPIYIGNTIASSNIDNFSNAIIENQNTTFNDSSEYINAVYKTYYGITSNDYKIIDDIDTITRKFMLGINDIGDIETPNYSKIEDYSTLVSLGRKTQIVKKRICTSNNPENSEKNGTIKCNATLGGTIQYNNNSKLLYSETNNWPEYDLYWLNLDNNYYKKMYISGRYGGVFTLNNEFDRAKRMRYIEKEDFMVGDVLLVHNKVKVNNIYNQLYLYVGNNTFKYVGLDGIVHQIVINEPEPPTPYRSLYTMLLGTDNFVILRPSLVQDTNDENYLNVSNYTLDEDNNILSNIVAGVTASNLFSNTNTNGEVSIFNKNNVMINNDDILCTGYTLKVTFEDNTIEYKLSVIGDVTGDGIVSINDVAKLFQHLRKTNIISEDEKHYIIAGDVVNDNNILLNDVAKLFQYVRGTIQSLN